MKDVVKWKEMSLSDCCQVMAGNAWKAKQFNYNGFGLPIIRIQNMGINQRGKFAYWERDYDNKFLVAPGDLLLSLSGSFKTVLWDGPHSLLNQRIMKLTPNDSIIQKEFLYYHLLSRLFEVEKAATETAIKNTSLSFLRSMTLLIPPLQEQLRIVSKIKELLERVEEIHSLQRRSFEELTALQASLFFEVESRCKAPLAPVGEVILGSRNGRSIRASNANPNGSVLTLSAVHDVTLDLNHYKLVLIDDTVAKKYSFKAGDVFVSRSNTRGLVGLSSVATSDSKRNMIYPDLLIKLETNPKKILPQFLASALRFPGSREQIRSKATGTSQSMVKISGASLKEVRIPLPNKDIQKTMIEKLSEYDLICKSLKKNMNYSKTEQLRNSVLQKAFSGEL